MSPDARAPLLRAAALVAGGTALAALLSTPVTSSYHYDLESSRASFAAATWQQAPPAECDEVLSQPHATLIYGTASGETLGGNNPPDGNHPQVIMALGGDDTLRGGNQHDCLVGGSGNDDLGAASDDDKHNKENGKDILLGGPGDDQLKSGNGKDYLDGGPGWDTCEGDNAKDVIKNCEVVIPPANGNGNGNGNGKSLSAPQTNQLDAADSSASDPGAEEAEPQGTDVPASVPVPSDS
jgi:hypothetical protein